MHCLMFGNVALNTSVVLFCVVLETHSSHVVVRIAKTKMKRQYQEVRSGSTRDPRHRKGYERPGKMLSLHNIEEFNGSTHFLHSFFTYIFILFVGNFPEFTRPKNVGSFSLDVHRKYQNDYSELRYLSMPPETSNSGSCKVKFDLRKGVSAVIEKDEESIRQKMLDDLLTWILQERKLDHLSIVDPNYPLKPLLVEFICYRGLLTMLIATPYESQENWTILATRFQNSIYLWQLKDKQKRNGFNSNSKQQEMSIWGFKFEQYLCAST